MRGRESEGEGVRARGSEGGGVKGRGSEGKGEVRGRGSE